MAGDTGVRGVLLAAQVKSLLDWLARQQAEREGPASLAVIERTLARVRALLA